MKKIPPLQFEMCRSPVKDKDGRAIPDQCQYSKRLIIAIENGDGISYHVLFSTVSVDKCDKVDLLERQITQILTDGLGNENRLLGEESETAGNLPHD